MSHKKTPICPECEQKFPGDPCTNCGRTMKAATKSKAAKMPKATRKKSKRRHGRATRGAR